jgi:hypothetical protein
MRENMEYFSSQVWLISLNMMISRSIHFLSNDIITSSLWLILHYIYMYLHIHASVDGHLGCLHSLAIVNSAAINMGVQVPLLYAGFDFMEPELSALSST